MWYLFVAKQNLGSMELPCIVCKDSSVGEHALVHHRQSVMHFIGIAGVYVLYYDGSDVRLLTRLCEHDRSAYAEGGRAAFGVYKTGDNVIIVGHDLQVTEI